MRTGVIYTESVVHLAPERFAAEAPYQIAIVTLAAEGEPTRITVRIDGERVQIGDNVSEIESRNGIPFFRKCPTLS